jgi:hypothetical protein
LQRNDIIEILTAIAIQKRRSERENASGLVSGQEVHAVVVEKKYEKADKAGAINLNTIIQAKKQELYENNQNFAENYNNFLRRLRKNLHIVLNFSPSGTNFRQRLV